MALAGFQGSVEFNREQPDPVLIPTSSVQAGSDRLIVETDDFWPMDSVTLIHSGTPISGYYSRNELDRARLHTTPEGALNDTDATVVDLNAITGPVILAQANSAQVSILDTLLDELAPFTTEHRLRSYPAEQAAYAAQAPAPTYVLQGLLQGWKLTMAAPEIDTTGLGDHFSESVRSTVSGSGTFDFIVDLFAEENVSDVDPLLRGILLTQIGSTARAKLVLRPEGDPRLSCGEQTRTYLSGGLYYDTSILLTSSYVTVNTTDQIVGSADFVTVGRVALRT